MSDEIVILGAGMHPWGKWGRNFLEYGVHAARAALKDAGILWRDVQFVSGANTLRCGYPGQVSGAAFAQALGWNGAQISSCYAACASGSQALAAARAQILAGECDVALVVGADATPKGFLAPQAGERLTDPDWVRFRLGITNPTYFALYARRRMALYGATEEDFALVKIKNAEHGSANPNARYRTKYSMEDVLQSAMVADPLRLLQICATSDGGAAVIVSSLDYAKKLSRKPVRIAAISTISPTFAGEIVEMPDIATDSAIACETHRFRAVLAGKAYKEASIGPEDIDLAEVYDLSTALELDWYEDMQFCATGEAERLIREGITKIGGKLPVNPSGGLACFGEAVPAQALAQVCEMTWQLRNQAGKRQVDNARVGITANQGLFGHGSCVIMKR